VAVSAGDSLETTMAAYGSGAVNRSKVGPTTIMNVDIGGGTSKIAVVSGGKVVDITAIDVGARLVCLDREGRILRVEEAGRRFARNSGSGLNRLGARPDAARALATCMADRLFEAMQGGSPAVDGSGLLRLDPLREAGAIDVVSFSGGVSEYIYGRESGSFGDLGPLLAAEIRNRVTDWGKSLERPLQGIRATVIGASQIYDPGQRQHDLSSHRSRPCRSAMSR